MAIKHNYPTYSYDHNVSGYFMQFPLLLLDFYYCNTAFLFK